MIEFLVDFLTLTGDGIELYNIDACCFDGDDSSFVVIYIRDISNYFIVYNIVTRGYICLFVDSN